MKSVSMVQCSRTENAILANTCINDGYKCVSLQRAKKEAWGLFVYHEPESAISNFPLPFLLGAVSSPLPATNR